MVREIDIVDHNLVPIRSDIRGLNQHVSLSGRPTIDPKTPLGRLVSGEGNVGSGDAGILWAKELVEPHYREITVQSHYDVPF